MRITTSQTSTTPPNSCRAVPEVLRTVSTSASSMMPSGESSDVPFDGVPTGRDKTCLKA